ncbi:MAG: hypothetical protein R2806_17030 [Saprospiraceae bacterium]
MFRLKLLPVLLATLWISLSEFVRNEYLLKSYWTSHYSQLGLTFPSAPVNGAIWGVWSLVFALVIFVLARKFSQWETTLLAWVIGFVMMWLVIGNLAVLPFGILPAAIPLSLLEAFLATWIVRQFQSK